MTGMTTLGAPRSGQAAAAAAGRADAAARPRSLDMLSAIFWLIVGSAGLLWDVSYRGFEIDHAVRRGLVVASAIAMTTGINFALYRLRWLPFWAQSTIGGLFSVIAGALHFLLAQQLIWHRGPEAALALGVTEVLHGVYYWAIIYFGAVIMSLAVIYHRAVRERDLRLSAAESAAYAAQMQALRYQISPHFLFNSLNSVASLIAEEENAKAETMVIALAGFIRSTLSLDPARDITLAEELALQRKYLGIEAERFSDRLVVIIDCPARAERCLVPSLILQPLVENAVKHGIGRSAGPHELQIGATVRDGRLRIVVENDARVARTGDAVGLGIGLTNVRQRLLAHHPKGATFESGFVTPTRYRAKIVIPAVYP